VPFAEQLTPMEVGKRYLVRIYLDKVDQRPTASSKINKFLSDENNNTFQAGQSVDLILGQTTDLGRKAIINHSHWGMLFEDELNDSMRFGQRTTGFIKRVRNDGRIDLSLKSGQQSRDENTNKILALLEQEGGFVNLHDKSDPKMIKRLLGMSKGAFKKSIGGLFKSGVITIETSGIRLNSK
jgi:hypothetical protein